MKTIIFSMLIFVSLTISAQTSLQDIPVINPANLTTITANRTTGSNYSILIHYDEIDYKCYSNMESEVICCAYQYLSYFKYKDHNLAKRDPRFIETQMTNSNNEELRLISALNIAKTIGCAELIRDNNGDPWDNEIPNYNATRDFSDTDKFIASLNTMNYGRLQDINTALMKTTLDKGYPIVIYFKDCQDLQTTLHHPNKTWGDYNYAVGITKTSLSNTVYSNHVIGVIVGYTHHSSLEFNGNAFIMKYPFGSEVYSNKYSSETIYIPFDKFNNDIFEYAIVPYNPCPDLMPTISGKDNLTCEEIYSVVCPQNTTIQWSVSADLNIISGNQSSIATISPAKLLEALPQSTNTLNIPIMFKSKVHATFTKNGLKHTVSKDLKVRNNEKPKIQATGIPMLGLNVGQSATLTVENLKEFNDSEISWKIIGSTDAAQLSNNKGKSITVTPLKRVRALSIEVTNTAGCAPDNSTIFNIRTSGAVIIGPFSNPAKGTLDIKLKQQEEHNISEISTLSDKDNGLITNYKLVLLDKNNHIVRQLDIIGNTESVSMDIDGLNPDLYILQLMSGNELIDSQKVMIR